MTRPAATALALLLAAPLSCGPDTNVHDEGRARVGAAPGLGPPSADASDEEPLLEEVLVEVSNGCLRVRVACNKAVDATLTITAGEVSGLVELGRGASLFDLALAPAGLPDRLSPGAAVSAVVTAVDGDGRRITSAPAAFQIPFPPPLPLAISEVLPNPAGPEATQEYLELVNRGAAPQSLAGLFLEDEAGRDPLPDLEIAAGARALVVGQGFDEALGADVPPRPGTLIVRLPGKLGRDGLKQTGEVVRLVAADGTMVSSYGGWVDTTRGAWQGKSVQRQPDEGACDHPRSWTTAPLTPTPGF